MASRESQIKNIISTEFRGIFDDSAFPLQCKKSKKQIWFPDLLPIDDEKGIPLKDGVGFVRLQETLKDNNVVAYIYKFCSNEYVFSTERSMSTTSDATIFSFHYDKEEDDQPYPPHVTVVYPSIRYSSRKIEFQEFLEFIRDNFFEFDKGSLIKKQSHIWVNRR